MSGRPPIIGIVGGIGSGKSAAARAFAGLGCIVSDSDALAHAALRDPPIRAAIAKRFGPEVLGGDGQVSRKVLGRIVFADERARRDLEAMVHPWINSERERAFSLAAPTTRACVIDAPLLLEAGLAPLCDAIVFIDAPPERRLERSSARGWDEAEFRRREAAQWPLERKRAAATHVIVNDGDLGKLAREVRRVLDRIPGNVRKTQSGT